MLNPKNSLKKKGKYRREFLIIKQGEGLIKDKSDTFKVTI